MIGLSDRGRDWLMRASVRIRTVRHQGTVLVTQLDHVREQSRIKECDAMSLSCVGLQVPGGGRLRADVMLRSAGCSFVRIPEGGGGRVEEV